MVGLCALQSRRGAGAAEPPERCRPVPDQRRHAAGRYPGAGGAARPRQSRARLCLPAGERARQARVRRWRACASTGRTPTRRCSASAGRTPRSGTTRARSRRGLELRKRNVLDAAVQESYLAVPYAFAKLNANAQSAEYYESAVSPSMPRTAAGPGHRRHPRGQHAAALLVKDQDARYGWFWQLKNLPDAPESRYLYALLAGHDFQEGLKNYRDLVYMGGTLDRWSDSIVAFEDMIETRERAYAERLPRADALLASGAVGKLQQRAPRSRRELSTIESAATTWRRSAPTRSASSGRACSASKPRWRARRTPGERRRCARACALVKGVLYLPPQRRLKARAVAGAPHPQGSRPGAARGAEPLDPRRARAQEHAGEHRRVRRARRRAQAAHRRAADAPRRTTSSSRAATRAGRRRRSWSSRRNASAPTDAGALRAGHDVRPRGQRRSRAEGAERAGAEEKRRRSRRSPTAPQPPPRRAAGRPGAAAAGDAQQ